MDLGRYLQLACKQDYTQRVDIQDDEEEVPIEDTKVPEYEFTDDEMEDLRHALSTLSTYDPASRGTPESVLRSPWFRSHDEV